MLLVLIDPLPNLPPRGKELNIPLKRDKKGGKKIKIFRSG
jgi:hypothetical protein